MESTRIDLESSVSVEYPTDFADWMRENTEPISKTKVELLAALKSGLGVPESLATKMESAKQSLEVL